MIYYVLFIYSYDKNIVYFDIFQALEILHFFFQLLCYEKQRIIFYNKLFIHCRLHVCKSVWDERISFVFVHHVCFYDTYGRFRKI